MRFTRKTLWMTLGLILAVSIGVAAQTAADFFDDTILHEIRLDIFPSDWQKLKVQYLDNTYYPCNFLWRYKGQLLGAENIGIRSRGTGSRSDVKPGLRVDFNRYEEGQTFFGLKSFVLRNNVQDASMLRERISMLFFQRMELPASREAHTRLYVNDQYMGLYTIVESVDKIFLKNHYGENDGYLYKYDYAATDPPYYFDYRGSDPALYSPKPFQPETHETDPDPRPIEAMVRVINQATDAEFLSKIAEYLDLKYFMTYVGIENFLGEQDGILGDWGMNNYYFYRFEKRNFSTFIPWDKSNAFYGGSNFSIWHNITDVPRERQNVLMRRALQYPELRNIYLETLAKCAWLAGGEGGFLEQEVNREYNQVRTAAYEDPYKQCADAQGNMRTCPNAQFDADVDFLRQYSRQRGAYVMSVVPQEISAVSRRSFSITDRGGVSLETAGRSASMTVGYGRIQPDAGSTTPAGVAIFGFRQNNVLVTEAGVPASSLIRDGRIYAEISGTVNTGLAIANPNSQAATVTFFFTDADGQNFGAGTLTIPANGQIARFLSDAPFNGGSVISGTLTFSSTLSVAVRALRGLINTRNEFLITTLPIAELGTPGSQIVMLPHFADGSGWQTQVVLVNPTDGPISGTVQFLGQGKPGTPAQPVIVTVSGQSGSTFNYTIPMRSSRRLQTAGTSSDLQTGSIRVTPTSGQRTPSVMEVFSFVQGGVTVTEAGVEGSTAASSFRLYAEASGNLFSGESGAIQTGVAIANPSGNAVNVTCELTTLAGKSLGLNGTVTVPANGQVSQFLSQIQGFSSMPMPFQGILRISTTGTAGISVVGLRGRLNERGDFLVTTTPPNNEASSVSNAEMLFPHLVDGGGYKTQLVLFSGSTGQKSAGTLVFVSQAGQPLGLVLW